MVDGAFSLSPNLTGLSLSSLSLLLLLHMLVFLLLFHDSARCYPLVPAARADAIAERVLRFSGGRVVGRVHLRRTPRTPPALPRYCCDDKKLQTC